MKNEIQFFLFVWTVLLVSPAISQNLTHVTVNGPSSIYVGEDGDFSVTFWDGATQVNYPGGTYYWDFTGAQVNSMDPNSLSLQFTSAGNGYVSYTYVTFDDLFWDQWDLTVYSDYCYGITPSAVESTPQSPGSVTLTANPAPSGFSYEWYDASGNNLLSTGQSYTTQNLTQTTTYRLAYRHTSTGCITEKVNVYALIKGQNYIKKYSAIIATTDENLVITAANTTSTKHFVYYDGLGRPIQENRKNASPTGMDVIVPIEYDGFGRQSKSYLPYTKDNGLESGEPRDQAIPEQSSFYNNHFGDNSGDYSYSENKYEESPLNRVIATYAPGDPWSQLSAEGGKPVQMEYLTNDATDKVSLWEVEEGQLLSRKNYDPGTLFKNMTIDEEGHQVIEFTDLQGRIVLKQIQAPEGNWAKTYYVYNDLGNLIFVLPPQTMNELDNGAIIPPDGFYLVTDDQNYTSISGASGGKIAYTPSGSVTASAGTTLTSGVEIISTEIIPTQEYLDLWVFQYKYDDRQRITEKKVPGADPVYLIYDQLDRLVMTQDGNQRVNNTWSFTKYDALDRPIIIGEKVINDSFSNIRNSVAGQTILWETYTGNGITKYSDNTYPTSVTESEIHSITYYDKYSFTTKSFSLQRELNSSTDGKIVPVVFPSVRGQITGTKIKILGTNSDYIETVNFYDDRYRLIQSKVMNFKDGEDVFSAQYDFAGRVRKTHLLHNNPTADISSTQVIQEYSFDHAGRMLSLTHKIDSDPVVVLVSNTYNELGELTNKDLADNYEDITYKYNIRSWMTAINNLSDGTQKLFEMDLEYDKAPSGHQAYNGNIGATAWVNPYESLVNRYNYNYDEMNRLSSADYSNGGVSLMGFDVTGISYDLNGNIRELQRKGNDELNNPDVIIDQLTYTYDNGNQLSKVSDSSGKTAGFVDGIDGAEEYLYDLNGNMIEDKNKGITAIEYNILNLPKKVTLSPSKFIEYTYDAAGTKHSMSVVDEGIPKTSDYLGGFVYENNELQFLQHEEGRIVAKRDETGNFNGFQYQYHLKDHLGNIRATFKTEPEDPDIYLATLEDDASTKEYEQNYFTRYGEITRINADIFDHTDDGLEKTYSMRLSGTGNEIYGLAKSLSVMPGDVVSAEVWAKYLDPASTGSAGTAFAQLIEDLSNNASSVVIDAISPGSEAMPSFIGLLGGNGEQNAGAPMAYLNLMVFDLNFQQVGNTLFKQISTAAQEDGSDVNHEYISINPVTITEPGYVYIYLSNENVTPVEVFFDDFEVTHTPTDIVQKDDYYPFGGTFNSYTSGTENLYKYNGKEEQKELETYDYGWRQYDPWLGRFLSVDPLADHPRQIGMSPYSAFWNNSIRWNDPDGQCPDCPDEVYVPIADHVYGAQVGDVTNNGWEVVRVDENKSGFQGALYKGIYNDKTEYIYATAGTQDLGKDGLADVKQVFGASKQYKESVTIANELSRNEDYKGVSFTGHSLGGGLASANALATEGKAVTFNAAGLSGGTKRGLGLTGNTANITAYIVSGEALDVFQRNVGLRAEGNNLIFLPGVGKNAVDKHMMKNVQTGFDIWQKIGNYPNIKTFNMNE